MKHISSALFTVCFLFLSAHVLAQTGNGKGPRASIDVELTCELVDQTLNVTAVVTNSSDDEIVDPQFCTRMAMLEQRVPQTNGNGHGHRKTWEPFGSGASLETGSASWDLCANGLSPDATAVRAVALYRFDRTAGCTDDPREVVTRCSVEIPEGFCAPAP